MEKTKNKLLKPVTLIALALIIGAALYIMIRGLGLQESLDFGAGAYFYTDIPDFDKYTEKASVETGWPYLVYAFLFILWGVLMYFLWKWIDRRSR